MKRIFSIFMTSMLLLAGCNNLNLSPLAEGSSENWYLSEEEILMSINDLYKNSFFPLDIIHGPDSWTDDWIDRENLTPVTNGTINGEWSVANNDYWLSSYKAIARCNTILLHLEKQTELSGRKRLLYEAEVKFMRATQYSRLISYFGDVIFYTEPLELNEAFQMARTDKRIVLQKIYEDYDFASEYLPVSYGSSIQKATKGAALGMKARIALYMSDYETAKTASDLCIKLNEYTLETNYPNLFLTKTRMNDEYVFILPRSVEYGVTFGVKNIVSRNVGGFAQFDPSWDLFCSFLCTDGLPIDESPLFDPHNPFKNRDPRCGYTIVEFQTPHLGFMYQPHPDSLEIMNFSTGKKTKNNDTWANAQYASFNGLLWKKGVDESWLENGYNVAPNQIILRFADVLLIYAEAKIELNEIDQSVLDALNRVRARAYGISDISQTDKYPAIVMASQKELRKILRIERRMEFAWEGHRYMDIIRWRLAEKVLNSWNYGLLDQKALVENVIKPGLWFFAETPQIDDDGVADFSGLYEKGYIKRITLRIFDKEKQYLWPLPSKDILINKNLKQNPGY